MEVEFSMAAIHQGTAIGVDGAVFPRGRGAGEGELGAAPFAVGGRAAGIALPALSEACRQGMVIRAERRVLTS